MTLLEPIVPTRTVFDADVYEQQLVMAINLTLKDIDSDFQKTMRTWKQPSEFTIDLAERDGDRIVGEVKTTDEIYGYVNNGTVPHDIFPRQAKVLHFLSGYRAKTSRRVIGSHQGGASGDDVFSKGVHHPGTEAREFDQEIAQRRQRTIQNNCTAALLRASKGR